MTVKSNKYIKRAESIINHLFAVYGIDTDAMYIQMVDEKALKERVVYRSTAVKLTTVDKILIKTCLKG
jgi:hypothetical protein